MKIKTTILVGLTCTTLAAQTNPSFPFQPEKPKLTLTYPGYKESSVLVKVNNSGKSGWNVKPISGMNADSAEMLISYQDGSYKRIKGPNHYSVSELTGGSDFFLYSDFVTRIHKDHKLGESPDWIANCPLNARYKDGTYRLKAKCIKTNDQSVFSPVDTFVLDNFKPYVHRVQMILNGQLIYDSRWECGDFCGGMFFKEETNTPVNTDDLNSGLDIVVHASEAMEMLTLDIPFFNLSNAVPSYISSDQTVFSFSLTPSSLDGYSSDPTVYILGKDFNGNDLLDLTGFVDHKCVTVPVRAATGWNDIDGIPQGIDSIHSIPFRDFEEAILGQAGKTRYIALSRRSVEEREDFRNHESFDLSVYPNPANDVLYVGWALNRATVRHSSNFSIELSDAMGRRICRQGFGDFDRVLKIGVGDLPNGVYILKIFNGKSKKIIISR